jgi:hypothetical protein
MAARESGMDEMSRHSHSHGAAEGAEIHGGEAGMQAGTMACVPPHSTVLVALFLLWGGRAWGPKRFGTIRRDLRLGW